MKKILLTIALYATIFASATCYAQGVSVGDVLQKVGAKSGAIYSPKSNQWIATNNATLISYKAIDLSAGAARADGVDVAISMNVARLNLSFLQMPILSYLNYLNVGFAGVKFNSDKHYPTGVYLSASWKI